MLHKGNLLRILYWRKEHEEEIFSLWRRCSHGFFACSVWKSNTVSWGDSLTRIGKGIEGTDAENWSMIKLDDGSIAYISSKYLSLTKPAAQQAASTNSGATGSAGSSTSTAPASGGEMATSATPPNVVHKTNGFSNGKSADPNWDPWDTQAKVIYGGSGG